MTEYNIYTIDGRELHNPQALLTNHFGTVFEEALDRLPADMFGRVLTLHVNGLKCYVIRRSAVKWPMF
jgi:hypothetical protein